jgi:hypothetical protein
VSVAFLFSLGLALAACGTTPTPSPEVASAAPTERPTPMAEPTPDSSRALDAFLAFIAADEMPMQVAWEGTIDTVDDNLLTVSASLADAGDSEEIRVTFVTEGVTRTTERVRVRETTYELGRDGVWWTIDDPATYELHRIFEGVAAAELRPMPGEDEGAWLLNVPSMPFDARLLGFAALDAEVTATTTEFSITIDGDGMPVTVHMVADVEIDHGGDLTPAIADFAWEFRGVGDQLIVRRPTEAWDRLVHADVYTAIRYPTERGLWERDEEGWLIGPGVVGVPWMAMVSGAGDVAELVEAYDAELGLVPLERTDVVIDGLPAVLSLYESKPWGEPMIEMTVMALARPNYGMQRLQAVTFFAEPGAQDDMRPLVDRALEWVTILDPLWTLDVGTCYTTLSSAGFIDVQVVPCEELHDYEVFHVVGLADGPAPAGDASTAIRNECTVAFGQFAGIEAEHSTLRHTAAVPNEAEWDAGTRVAVCLARDPATDGVQGSLRNAGR